MLGAGRIVNPGAIGARIGGAPLLPSPGPAHPRREGGPAHLRREGGPAHLRREGGPAHPRREGGQPQAGEVAGQRREGRSVGAGAGHHPFNLSIRRARASAG
jgi:hypothetical protein